MSLTPYYDDGTCVIYHASSLDEIVPRGSVACVAGSPPYNVGVEYDQHIDSLPWPAYWEMVDQWARVIADALEPTGRSWVNVAPVVQEQPGGRGRNGGPHSGRSRKARESLVAGWSTRLDAAGLSPADLVAWQSMRGSGTAWGSWQSPSAPNLRGDWEAILVHYNQSWPRTPPAGQEGWKDTLGNWPALVSNVWEIRPETRDGGHPVPFPVEVPARAIRLSTWPGEIVLDPWMGSGATLLAARALGRRAIGVELSERYCEHAALRLGQAGFDFGGAA